MLIYNYQKEFIGIDEDDLKTLGFSNLSQLRSESADFADLFVRTPGFIHNFKHVHWIDFVACADPSESSRVIIDVNGKTFKANISINTVYLTDSPTSKAYLVNLNNLKSLSSKETENISAELAQRPTPVAAAVTPEPQAPVVEPFVQEEIKTTEPKVETFSEPEENFSAPLSIDVDDYDLPEETPLAEEPQAEINIENAPLSIETDSFELDDFEVEEATASPVIDEPVSIPEETIDEHFDYDYQYDPQVASDELGLPIDLIEEFIQDFIAQANEFKDGLYSSLEADDLDNVKILSHKLKGVAANLRIEDAFNTLSVINTSSDSVEIRSFLATFYKIIAKLSGEEIKAVETPAPLPEIEESVEEELSLAEDLTSEDDLSLANDIEENAIEDEDDLYQDYEENLDLAPNLELEETSKIDEVNETTNEDEDVPTNIEMPELADDDFLEVPTEVEEITDLDLSISNPEEDDLELAADIDDFEIEETSLEIEPLAVEYSKEQVASEIGLDSDTFNELFSDFIDESKSSAQVIKDAINDDNFTRSKQEAIKLKGMSDNMRVSSFSKELNVLVTSSDKNEMIQAIDQIDTIIEQISK